MLSYIILSNFSSACILIQLDLLCDIQVSISSNGLPSTVDATIESEKVSFALFDVFFGDTPVSPPLKASVATGLEFILK